jgi:hypothetical protein
VWFGVLLCVNMQTSFIHPPFGFALFYLRGIAPPEVKSSDIYWGAMPWVLMQVILVIIVIYWPGAVTYWIDNTRSTQPTSRSKFLKSRYHNSISAHRNSPQQQSMKKPDLTRGSGFCFNLTFENRFACASGSGSCRSCIPRPATGVLVAAGRHALLDLLEVRVFQVSL